MNIGLKVEKSAKKTLFGVLLLSGVLVGCSDTEPAPNTPRPMIDQRSLDTIKQSADELRDCKENAPAHEAAQCAKILEQYQRVGNLPTLGAETKTE
jgi:hypothetical protein